MAEDQSQDWSIQLPEDFHTAYLNSPETDLTEVGRSEELADIEESSVNLIESSSTPSTPSQSISKRSETFLRVDLFWENLSYSIKIRNISKLAKFPWISYCKSEKFILNLQSGFLRSGTLTAVLGPSGAGKSTLLECLSGRKRINLKGDVFVRVTDICNQSQSVDINESKIPTVAFIGQKDNLIGVLTVRESLSYAAKLKNLDEKVGSLSKEHCNDFNLDHRSNAEDVINNIIGELGLENCADIRVSKCSGGQAKRLSFALELISKPKILILDEPFSGLDSSSALQCVKLLKRLTSPSGQRSSPLGIIASVHQPSARLLYTFQYLYILTKNGHCLYQGFASDLVSHFAHLGLKCPQFHNPADFVIEIASGEYGQTRLQTICDKERSRQLNNPSKNDLQEGEKRIRMSTIVDRMTNQRFSQLLHTWILLQRTWISTRREPLLTWLRLFQHIFVALIASFMYTEPIGEPNGCFIDLIGTFSLNNTNSAPTIERIQKGFLDQYAKTSDNVTLMFFVSLFIVFANTMPTVLTFPLEMSNYLKERRNAWYGSGAFYIAKFLADTPFQIFIPIILCSILYFVTNQIRSIWRFSLFCLIMIILASISQSVGILVSIIFVDNMSAAVFMACLSLMPFFLVGGFFNGHSQDSIIFAPIVILSFVRYSFFALLITIYGLDRCSMQDDKSKEDGTLTSSDPVSDLSCLLGCSKDSLPLLNMMKEYNLSSKQSEWISAFLGVEPNCMQTVMESLEKISFDDPEDTNPTQNATVSAVSNSTQSSSSASYILTHYDITDDILWHNILILVAFLIVLRFVAYLWLLYKTNRKLRE